MAKPFNHLRFLFLSLSLLVSYTAFCWGQIGHRTVAQIAEQHLSKKAKKGIRQLIGKQHLAYYASWADFIKSDSTWDHAGTWHYVDLPGHISRDSFVAGLKLLPGKNLYTMIPEMAAQLRNRDLPDSQRREALYWLIHLLGDLHQPLHVGRDEDEGGNKVKLEWMGRKTNLHSLWDSILPEFQQYSFTEYAGVLDVFPEDLNKGIAGGTLEDWFYESHQLSDTIYDSSPADAKLGYEYNYRFVPVLEQQLLRGGLRLARMLNESFE